MLTQVATLSTFAGKGKLGALKLLRSSKEVQETFAELGQEWNVAEELMDKLENFTCLLYASKCGTKELNSLRYHLFCAKKGGIESHQLPPCNDCFRKHVQRANYQAAIWKRSLQRHPMTPSPVGKGWKWDDQDGTTLAVDWMSGQPAPQALLDLLACNCSRSCKLPSCGCSGLKCTDMCKLATCDNQPLSVESDDDSLGEDDPSDERGARIRVLSQICCASKRRDTFVMSFQTFIFCYK